MTMKNYSRISLSRMRRERGMSMIELLIAMTVMAVGISGILALVLLAIASNTRSKGDSTAIMLAQLVIEQAEMIPANGVVANGAGGTFNVTTVQLTDCAGTVQTLNLAAGGAQLVAANGQIDWGGQTYAAVPAGYKMYYAACTQTGVAGQNNWMLYEVRWNIWQPYGAMSKVIVVSARPAAAAFGGVANFKNFANPVTLRTVVTQ
jgi:prepilin-type N-terminal cleavage/methylation domain-containing protein